MLHIIYQLVIDNCVCGTLDVFSSSVKVRVIPTIDKMLFTSIVFVAIDVYPSIRYFYEILDQIFGSQESEMVQYKIPYERYNYSLILRQLLIVSNKWLKKFDIPTGSQDIGSSKYPCFFAPLAICTIRLLVCKLSLTNK